MKVIETNISELPSAHDSVFSSKEWASFYLEGTKAYHILNSNNERVGSFLLYHKAKAGQSMTITPPFSPHIGLQYGLHAEKESTRISERKKIHEAICDFLKMRNDRLIEISMAPTETDIQVYQWKGFDIRPRYTYHIDLTKTKEALLSEMTAGRRKNIVKAEKDGLKTVITEDLDLFKSMLRPTLSKSKGTYNEVILDRLLSSDQLREHRDLWICYDGDDPQTCALIVHDANAAYYLLGARKEGQLHQGAQALILYSAMLEAKGRGCVVFDLEGSMILEVERFFRGFGGKKISYYEIQKSSLFTKFLKWVKGRS